MFRCFLCALFIIFNAKITFGGNVLIAIDLPSPSHQIWHYALAKGLIEKGHNVTLIGPFSDKGQKSDLYHPLVVEDTLKEIRKYKDFDIEESISKMNVLGLLKIFIDRSYTICEASYKSKGFRTLLNYSADFKFDLIIIDMTLDSCFYPLIQRFNYPPTIGSTGFLLPPFLSATFGNGLHPSYIPFYHLQYSEDMTFFQRLLNYLSTYADYFLRQTYQMQRLETLARQIFGDDMASMHSLERHISLLLCNINIAVNQPQSVSPNIVAVGGLHIKSSKQLPKDFQNIMDNADEGVILFCLGTNVRSDKMNSTTINALLDVFGQLKQTVIWKFESSLENVPNNVVIRKWVPQSSILGRHRYGHPNLRLFISHGGALSVQEAAYHGVPIIGMPFFIDQRAIVSDIVKRKLGLKLDAATVTTEGVFETISEMLTNPVYSNNMKEVSRRMRDLPYLPLETAVFWAEYAMKHNGTHFLNPKSRDMSLHVAKSADVELFLMILLFLLMFLIFVSFKSCGLVKFKKNQTKNKAE